MLETGLRALSPHDFEILCQDLLGKKLGAALEGFTAGRDGGIDLRLLRTSGAGSEVVVQCKHYIKSGYPSLKSKITAEAERSARIEASRFILATSVEMTPGRKSELSQMFTDKGVSCREQDIYGREDLEQILRNSPDIERRHHKLWLSSSTQLQQLINNGVLVRSEGYLEELSHNVAFFVQNQSVEEAIKRLKDHHTCLISGAPGVGKTTLAEILLLHAIGEGYQPIIVSSDIAEADQNYLPNEKQVFLYDDFLGMTTTFERQGKNEDDRLLRFIKRVKKSSTKRLLLTTREYIFQQAKIDFERFSAPPLDLTKYVLDIGVYTRRNRAHILYNHIYFSMVSPEARQSIRRDQNYNKLIDHKNYNPRLISDAVALFSESGEPDSRFCAFLLRAFENPEQLWSHVFQHQFTSEARALLAFVPLMETPATRDALELAHTSLARGGRGVTFADTMRVLEGTALTIITEPQAKISFVNPGVLDAVLGALLNDTDVLLDLMNAAFEFNQLVKLWTYASEPERSVLGTHKILYLNTSSSASHLLTIVDRERAVLRPSMRRRLKAVADRFLTGLIRLLDTGFVGNQSRAVRLSLVIGIAEDLGATSATQAIEDGLLAEVDRWYSATDKEPVLELVIRADQCEWLAYDARRTLHDGALAWFTDSLYWPKDFWLLASLLELGSPEPDNDAKLELRQEFEEQLRNCFSEWSDSDEADLLMSLLDDIESASDALNYDLARWTDWDYERQRVLDRIEELESDPNESFYEWQDHHDSTKATNQDDAAWIVGLYDTLSD